MLVEIFTGIFTGIGVGSVGLVLLAALLQLLNFLKEKKESEALEDTTPHAYNRNKEMNDEIEKYGYYLRDNYIFINNKFYAFASISEETIELFKKYKSVMNITFGEYHNEVKNQIEEINNKKIFKIHGHYTVHFIEKELLKRLRNNYRKEVIQKLKNMDDNSHTTTI